LGVICLTITFLRYLPGVRWSDGLEEGSTALHRTEWVGEIPLAADRWRPNARYRTVRGHRGVVNSTDYLTML
jgi:hypothetical protein